MEFALIVPIFFILLFGVIDYGVVFTDSVTNRNGVREAARRGVVSNFQGTSLSDLRVDTKSQIVTLSGTPAVKVYVPGGVWNSGADLVVCSIVATPGIVHFPGVPTPASLKSKVKMSIETESLPPTGSLSSADAGDWSWC